MKSNIRHSRPAWLALAAALLAVGGHVYADTTISALPAGAALGGTEPVPIVQSAATVRTTPAAISTYTIGQLTSANVAGKWTGTCDVTTFLRGDGACALASLTTNVSGILPGANGGTGNGFFAVTGPTTALRTFTFPNASSTVLTSNALVTVAQGGIGVGTLTGVAKGNGTSAFTAAASADVIGLWSGTCSSTTFLRGDGACQTPAGAGTVTSVAMTVPALFSVAGSPVTTSGTLAVTVAGTSGGIPYFSSGTALATSAALAANAVVVGGGAGVAPSTTTTLSGIRINTRIQTAADATSITPTGDTADQTNQANTQTAGTLTINAPTGTPTDGQKIVIRLKSTNVQTYSWNAIYRGSTTLALPSVSSGSAKTDYLGFLYNTADTKWDFVSISNGF